MPLAREPRLLAAIRTRSFKRDDGGLAAVEFAIILPVLLLIYLGLVELSRGVRAARQLDLVAHAVADLTGQVGDTGSASSASQLDDTTLEGIIAAGQAMLTPLPTSSLKITISEILIQSHTAGATTNYYATVNWSFAYNGASTRTTAGCNAWGTAPTGSNSLTASDTAAPVSFGTLPTHYTSTAGGNTPVTGPIIVVDVQYSYKPIVSFGAGMFGSNGFGGLFTSSGMTMQRTAYGTVRNQYAFTAPYASLVNHIQYPAAAAVTNLAAQTPAITGTNCLSTIN
jgi:Flp pilus assembly protein TadG